MTHASPTPPSNPPAPVDPALLPLLAALFALPLLDEAPPLDVLTEAMLAWLPDAALALEAALALPPLELEVVVGEELLLAVGMGAPGAHSPSAQCSSRVQSSSWLQ